MEYDLFLYIINYNLFPICSLQDGSSIQFDTNPLCCNISTELPPIFLSMNVMRGVFIKVTCVTPKTHLERGYSYLYLYSYLI